MFSFARYIFLCLLLAACADESDRPPSKPLPVIPLFKRIQGVTLDAREVPGEQTLGHLAELGVTHIAVIPFGFQERHDSPEIRHNPDARWYSESDAGIRILARQADSLGMHLLLKPHLWAGDFRSGKLPSDIGFRTEKEWLQWEAQYRAFLLHYARLSQEIKAPLLCIGTELARVVRERPDFWRALIQDIRAVYDGKLTYAANWYGEYEHITFWDDLDYIGVQAYFPLSPDLNPTLAALKEGWEKHRADLADFGQRFGKPVLFTEIGYRSVPFAAAEPWRWPSREEDAKVAPDDALQARLYQAFFESMWQQPGFAGAIIWKWYAHDESRPERHRLDFTPQGKPAEHIIGQWFRNQNLP